jgi:hypothetical protein
VTNYYYTVPPFSGLNPPSTYAYTNPNGNPAGRVMLTILDGFGRTITQQSGTGSYNSTTGVITMGTVISQVDTTYAPCGCRTMRWGS